MNDYFNILPCLHQSKGGFDLDAAILFIWVHIRCGSVKNQKMVAKTEECNLRTWLSVSCAIGLILSAYATYVEINVEKDHSYKAMCDISEAISCTKVFSSSYGKGFGLLGSIFGEDSIFNSPNGMIGVVFYILIALLGFINIPAVAKIVLTLCAVSNLMSLYLAYLLYFVLEDFCVVCVSTYAVNFANLLIALERYNQLKKLSTDSLKKLD